MKRHDNRHHYVNSIQTALLILTLLGISALAGGLIFGKNGMWLSLGASILALFFEPSAASAITLRLFRARPILPAEAPGLWEMLRELSLRANLSSIPIPHYIPSSIVNAFSTGSRNNSAIAFTDGLLRSLTARELAGVIGHEIAHIANGDLRVMGLADYVSRLTNLLALAGQLAFLVSIPLMLVGAVYVNWGGLLLLAISPHLALLAQLGLSRVREFDADRVAVQLTGDPQGLASALAKIERVSRSWRAWLFPGWGNPEPSWLRTHPATADRIARLMELVPRDRPILVNESIHSPLGEEPVTRSPRWHLGGFWR